MINFSANSGDLTLRGLTVTGGRTFGYGGGIRTFSGSVTLTSSTVSGNQSVGAGGGIFTIAGNVTLTSSTVSGNQSGLPWRRHFHRFRRRDADQQHGQREPKRLPRRRLFTDFGNVTLTSSTVSGNQSGFRGGGIFTDSGDVTLTSSTVSGNQSVDAGGGICTFSGNVTLTSSTVSGNQSGWSVAAASARL